MRKRDEIVDPKSCLNKATDDEILFVLLSRDSAAPATIRFWVEERQRLGEDWDDSPKLIEARKCAFDMEKQQGKL